MNNWKKLAAAVILAGAVVMIQGCGGNGEEAKSMEKGRVWKAATEAAYPPFRYVDENRNLVGFEVDLLKEIGRRTGATIEFRDMPFDRLLDAVAGKQVDMAIGAITVTKEREKLVAAKRGSTSEARAKAQSPKEIISMDHYEDIFKALEAGKADVGITGDQAALYELEHGGSSRLSLSGTIPTEDNFAIALSKDNPQLKKEINEALKSMMDDGTYDSLAHKWFFVKAADKE